MKKLALSVEEMHKLESLGLDTSNASTFYEYTKSGDLFLLPNSVPKINKINEYTNAYTLQDILKILYSIKPEVFYSKNSSYYVIISFYEYCDGIRCSLVKAPSVPIYEVAGIDALDAAYKTLIWCIENEYIEVLKK